MTDPRPGRRRRIQPTAETWTPVGWPDWTIEQEGHRFDVAGAYVGKEPMILVKRATHVPTGSILERRWNGTAYSDTWTPSLADPDPVARYRIARLVIADEPPPRPGPQKPRARSITGDQVFKAVVTFRRRYGRLPTQAQLVDPKYGPLIPTTTFDVRQLERAIGGSWDAIRFTADQFVGAELDLAGKARRPT